MLRNILFVLMGGIMHLFAADIEIDGAKNLCRIEGVTYPSVGLGTYPLRGEICTTAVACAANDGYRIIDTATFYDNFESIAQAIKGQDRKELYIISKVWHDQQSPLAIRHDLQQTLKRLDINYLDAYLLHWPNSAIPIEETLYAMDALREEGKIRHIGLSNVTVNHLKRALEVGVPITWVQVEMHPYFYDKELLDFCQAHGIFIQAWRPLDLGRIKDDPILVAIGNKHGKTPCQVALRWIVQHDCIPLPGSKSETHIKENFNSLNFSLSSEEMEQIDHRAALGKRCRVTHDFGLGFCDEFDLSYEECWPK
jgi:2,5-diketo-D-gluconate reductase B